MEQRLRDIATYLAMHNACYCPTKHETGYGLSTSKINQAHNANTGHMATLNRHACCLTNPHFT